MEVVVVAPGVTPVDAVQPVPRSGHQRARAGSRIHAPSVPGLGLVTAVVSVAMRLGIAHHLGWAVAVTASADHRVVDRRRLELIEPGLPIAPVEHEAQLLDDAAATAVVTAVRSSAVTATSAALDQLAAALPEPIVSMSLRYWPADFPDDIAAQRRPPYQASADSVMYRQVLAELAHARGWALHLYDARVVVSQATRALGVRADEVLSGPAALLGPPWTRDHRMALAAAIMAG